MAKKITSDIAGGAVFLFPGLSPEMRDCLLPKTSTWNLYVRQRGRRSSDHAKTP